MSFLAIYAETFRLGTRGSLLARAQSGIVAQALEARQPGLRVELVVIKTSGDQIVDRPLHQIGGKGLFIKELEEALLGGTIDFAVHSFKDMPVTMPLVAQDKLVVAAVPIREDPRDALVSRSARTLAGLPLGSRIGTGSLRRQCQIHAARPDLRVEPIRGNIDTRLRKMRDGEFDAVLLAMAGIIRARLFDSSIMFALEPDTLLPAPGQGALALQCRRDDSRIREALSVLHDPDTADCVAAERDLVMRLQGDCLSPIAALASIDRETIRLRAAVGRWGGHPPVLTASASSGRQNPSVVSGVVFDDLASQGAPDLLHRH